MHLKLQLNNVLEMFIHMNIEGSKNIQSSSLQVRTASSSSGHFSPRVTRSRSRRIGELGHDISPVAAMRNFLIAADNSYSTDNDGNDEDDNDVYHDAVPFGQLGDEDAVIYCFRRFVKSLKYFFV